MLCFADDIAVIHNGEQELSNQKHTMEEVLSKQYNLKINMGKQVLWPAERWTD